MFAGCNHITHITHLINNLLRNVAAVVGVCWFVCLVWRQLKVLGGWFRAYLLAPWGIARINLKEYGPWAGIIQDKEQPLTMIHCYTSSYNNKGQVREIVDYITCRPSVHCQLLEVMALMGYS